jgi:hypothetical protein
MKNMWHKDKYRTFFLNPLPLLFEALLQGQNDRIFFQRTLNLHTTTRALYSVKASTGRLNPKRFGMLGTAKG